MDFIEHDLPISEARANLTEVVNVVRLQERCIALTKRGEPQAMIVPIEIGELIRRLGLESATAALRQAGQSAPPAR
jgi:prevent-host-death family protein